MCVRITIIWPMMVKLVWTTAPTVTSFVQTTCAFHAYGGVMEMMIVVMALMSPLPAHRDIVHQVTLRFVLRSRGVGGGVGGRGGRGVGGGVGGRGGEGWSALTYHSSYSPTLFTR